MSETTLLTVAIPVWEAENLLPLFGFRVVNLLGMIGTTQEAIDQEIRYYDQVQFAKTESRSILGTMNEIAWLFQYRAENARKKEDYSLSKVELELSNYRYPADVAKEILYKGYFH